MREAGIALDDPFQAIPEKEIIHRLSQAALALGLPLAVWRLPGRQEQQLLIDLSGSASPVQPVLEDLPAGFLFTPYGADLSSLSDSKKQSLLIKGHIHYRSGGRLLVSEKLSAALAGKAERLLQKAAQGAENTENFFSYAVRPGQQAAGTSREGYIRLVEQAVDAIKAEAFQKVVCARSKRVQLPESFQPVAFFQQLCGAYANAFVSFVSIPGVGSWVGATPETLISIDGHKVFRTMALAGTQPKTAASSPADAVWRQKEIEEQALVSRYVINCFKKIRLREFEELGPRTVVAGNLMHLRTDFKVDIQASGFPELGSLMLSLLHPTSAVCGMPKAAAQAFLDAREGLDRQFFAGFLGPVNLQQETRLFVNLRCMQLLRGEAMLYAGAGITADSVAEREWQETEDKCATLAALLESGAKRS